MERGKEKKGKCTKVQKIKEGERGHTYLIKLHNLKYNTHENKLENDFGN